MKCDSCQQDNPPGARFCNNCTALLPSTGGVVTPAGPASFASGRYRVERVLGEGGKGIVSLCQDSLLGRRVAIKLIKQEVMDPESLSRFEREVQAMSLLDESLATSSELGMRPLMEQVLSRREILGA